MTAWQSDLGQAQVGRTERLNPSRDRARPPPFERGSGRRLSVELARREFLRDNGNWPDVAQYLASFSGWSAIAAEPPRRPAKHLAVFGAVDEILRNAEALPSIRFATRIQEVDGIGEAYRLIHPREADLSKVTVVETGARRTRSSEVREVIIDVEGVRTSEHRPLKSFRPRR